MGPEPIADRAESSPESASSAPTGQPMPVWLATGLSLIIPGLGQIAAGRFRRGLSLTTAHLVVVTLGLALSIFALPRGFNVGVLAALVATSYTLIAIDAARVARRPSALSKRHSTLGRILLGMASFGMALVWALLCRTYFAQSYYLPSRSMSPALMIGDHFLADKLGYRFSEPRRGDVVVLDSPLEPHRRYTKRIIGLPGDRVAIRDRIVFINGERLDEDYARWDSPSPGIRDVAAMRDASFPEATVPAEKYFVLGDNRFASMDSREWGFLDRGLIVGKAAFIYWSRELEQRAIRWSRIGQTL